MTLFFLRDDDANATTDPDRFQRAFQPLFDVGCKVNLSVIPEVALDTLAPDGTREQFLNPDHAPSSAHIRMNREHPMARWIQSHRAIVEPLVHGLTHRRVRENTEFGALTQNEALHRMQRGKAILDEALNTQCRGFVAPWDALSRGSVEAATSTFELLSTSWLHRSQLPMRHWPAHYIERIQRAEKLNIRKAMVLRHRGGPVQPELPPERVSHVVSRLAQGVNVCVIVLHHWMFWGQREPHPVIQALAHTLRYQRTVSASELVL